MLRTPAIAHHPHSLFLFAPANPSVRLLGVLSGDEDLHDPSHLHNTPDVGTRYSARYSDVRRVNVRAGGAAPAAHPPPRLGRWAPTPLLDLRVPGMCVRARKHARARARAHTHTHTNTDAGSHARAHALIHVTGKLKTRPESNPRARAHTHIFTTSRIRDRLQSRRLEIAHRNSTRMRTRAARARSHAASGRAALRGACRFRRRRLLLFSYYIDIYQA